jgi:VIT1/CCC1 family predicted Fe2+/Mn2+ transporter
MHQAGSAGVAGLVAGALSMAAGECVSVSSQADTEQAELDLERFELATQPEAEEDSSSRRFAFAAASQPELARAVARQLMARDPRNARARRARAIRRPRRPPVSGGVGDGRLLHRRSPSDSDRGPALA